jgi:peptidoglycan/LPS O-acetylase OafA/YrhL
MEKYRPDIDGLRAVAVLSVFVYHLYPQRFPAGGIGVDVFLVISGFLIGGILLREARDEEFSLVRFYERRVRRIAPAFLVMIAITTGLGLGLLLPSDLIVLSNASIAAVLSASNFYFWQTADYFNTKAADIAQLHTWSLGVEEQFYLIAPLLIMTIQRKAPQYMKVALCIATAVSFAFSVWEVGESPTGAFYLPHSRAWELLVGVLLNLFPLTFLRVHRAREIAVWLGAAGLAISFIVIRPSDGFPGYAAVLPCLSTALIIGAGQQGQTSLGRLLSFKPVLFVGLISYSLYLWHWPAIVFVRQYFVIAGMPLKYLPIPLALSFIAATASWRFVERPFRSKHIGRRTVFSLAAAFSIALIGMNAVISGANGFPQRVPIAALAFDHFGDNYPSNQFNYGNCFVSLKEPLSTFGRDCLVSPLGTRPILLLGDSHAGMYRQALAGTIDTPILEAAAVGCHLEIDATGRRDSKCATLMKKVMATLPSMGPLRGIVLSSRWHDLDTNTLGMLVENLKRYGPVYLIGPVPEYDMSLPKLLAMGAIKANPHIADKHLILNRKIESKLVGVAAAHDVIYLSPIQVMCKASKCMTMLGDDPMYQDKDHLTSEGASFVLKRMLDDRAI